MMTEEGQKEMATWFARGGSRVAERYAAEDRGDSGVGKNHETKHEIRRDGRSLETTMSGFLPMLARWLRYFPTAFKLGET